MKEQTFNQKMASLEKRSLGHVKRAFADMSISEISDLGLLARDGHLGLMVKMYENLKELSYAIKDLEE